jgi:two-component system response regulator AtoC
MMLSYTIYVVDDEETIRDGIALHLGREYRIETFVDAESALREMQVVPPDLILLDIGLPGMDGIEALKRFKEVDPHVEVIMITAYEDIQTVVTAMKSGAHDYVVKPIHMDGLQISIRNALETLRLRKEIQLLQETYLKENLPFFVGESDAIKEVMDLIGMTAKSADTPILIVGETGTGKELIASAIHYRSPNFKGPLVTVNCAAIPKDLIESELFGYEKGAFSGASTAGKRGLVEEAEGGTLFLDEVGDLSLEAQAKLLRFLEEGEFYRVGGTSTVNVKTRVVSATNKDVGEMIKGGLFRKDLYFRVGVIRVEVPSLNEREDDIIPLAEHFLLEFRRKFDKPVSGLSEGAGDALLKHTWVGNVRELKNCIERGVLTCRGSKLSAKDLGLEQFDVSMRPTRDDLQPEFPPITPEGIDYPALRMSFERYYIEQSLKLADGNESKAARLLGINHHTFRYHKKKLEES